MSDPIYGYQSEIHFELPAESQLRLDINALAEASLRKQIERLEREVMMFGKAGYTPRDLTIMRVGSRLDRVVPRQEIERG